MKVLVLLSERVDLDQKTYGCNNGFDCIAV